MYQAVRELFEKHTTFGERGRRENKMLGATHICFRVKVHFLYFACPPLLRGVRGEQLAGADSLRLRNSLLIMTAEAPRLNNIQVPRDQRASRGSFFSRTVFCIVLV